MLFSMSLWGFASPVNNFPDHYVSANRQTSPCPTSDTPVSIDVTNGPVAGLAIWLLYGARQSIPMAIFMQVWMCSHDVFSGSLYWRDQYSARPSPGALTSRVTLTFTSRTWTRQTAHVGASFKFASYTVVHPHVHTVWRTQARQRPEIPSCRLGQYQESGSGRSWPSLIVTTMSPTHAGCIDLCIACLSFLVNRNRAALSFCN